MKNNRQFPSFVFSVITVMCLGLFPGCAPVEETPPQPNIIIVLADDLGYGDLTCFNPEGKIETPYLDQMAAEGIRFTDAHSGSAVCTPTRYGLITGRYAWRSKLKSGVLTGKSKALIPADRTTLAGLLKRSGYYSAFIGKWHLGWDWALKDSTENRGEGWSPQDFDQLDFTKPVQNVPNDLGFDYAYGHSGSLDMAPYVYVENGEVTAQPNSITVDTGKYTWWREGPTGADFIHDQVTPNFFRKSMAFIEQRSTEDDPFLLYLALPSPHTPILPLKEWQGKSGLNPYGDFVVMIDDYMGQLFQTLKAAGIDENTLVVFTSDNGCSPEADFPLLAKSGHHPGAGFRGHKADIYEAGHRVPFIVRWPAKIKMGASSDATLCLTDIFATCADIVGVPLSDEEGPDSYSFLPLLENPGLNNWERTTTIHHSINGSFAIREGDWKLIFCGGSGGWSYPTPKVVAAQDTFPQYQLYNLESDPAEKNNLLAQYPEKVAALKKFMQETIKNGRSTLGEKQQNDVPSGPWKQRDLLFQ